MGGSATRQTRDAMLPVRRTTLETGLSSLMLMRRCVDLTGTEAETPNSEHITIVTTHFIPSLHSFRNEFAAKLKKLTENEAHNR